VPTRLSYNSAEKTWFIVELGRLAGTLISGWGYQTFGLEGCLWLSCAFVIVAGLISGALATLPFKPGVFSRVDWQGSGELAAGDELYYPVRAWDAQGRLSANSSRSCCSRAAIFPSRSARELTGRRRLSGKQNFRITGAIS